MKTKHMLLLACMLLPAARTPSPLRAALPADVPEVTCPVVKLQVEQLPDLNIPRTFHSTLCAGGELLVAGGHTSGFVPTATAEYYSDGEWHVVNTVYAHDGGLSVQLRSGQVMFAGGFEKDLGIGQIHSVERYTPSTHTFEGFGCLDTRRAYASAVEIDSGQLVVSGNWYHADGIERFDGRKLFSFADTVSRQRAYPYIFRTSRDNAMVLGAVDTKGQLHEDYPDVVDRLHGGPLHIGLLRTWQPIHLLLEHRANDSFIGDEERGQYVYLMTVQNRAGELAVALVRNGDMELLPTACNVPAVIGGKQIIYATTVIADRHAQRGYMVGSDRDNRRYVVIIEYARAIDANFQLTHTPATLTVGYTDPLDGLGCPQTSVLTTDGDLLLAGGSLNYDNFMPSAKAFLLRVGQHDQRQSAFPWWAVLLAAGALGGAAYWAYRSYKAYKAHKSYEPHKSYETHKPYKPNEPYKPNGTQTASPPSASAEPLPLEQSQADEALMARICQLMEERQFYLRPELKLADVAAELSTNTSYITTCIRQCRGCTFPQLVATYRVERAKQLLRDDPEMKFNLVCVASGFSNESTFFRTFKRVAGMTPSEWTAEIKH